jgi:hypothetical protein
MRKIRGKLLVCSGALLAIAAIAFFYNTYRNGAMARLYAEAAGYPQVFRSTTESQAAVKKLATYKGRKSTGMLLEIALGHGPFVWPETRTEAIKALHDRNDPDVAVALANLLQPHEGLNSRQAAATALKDLPCNSVCIRSVLHYFERIWHGELNYEDRTIRPLGFEDATTNLKKDQQTLYSTLYLVLRREKVETFTSLAQVYGLGSDTPSTFALDLVSRLGLPEGCLYLQESKRRIKDDSPQFFKAPRQELQSALASLNCK